MQKCKTKKEPFLKKCKTKKQDVASPGNKNKRVYFVLRSTFATFAVSK